MRAFAGSCQTALSSQTFFPFYIKEPKARPESGDGEKEAAINRQPYLAELDYLYTKNVGKKQGQNCLEDRLVFAQPFYTKTLELQNSPQELSG